MKHYLLFAGDQYYPGGGARDYISSHDTEGEAKAASMQKFLSPWVKIDWAHIGYLTPLGNLRIIAEWNARQGWHLP